MIDNWLKKFEKGWLTKDVDMVLSLFSEDVDYWETPFQNVENKEILKQEWSVIKYHKNVELEFEVYASSENKHAIYWQLSYTDNTNKNQNWAGTYLLELNENGKCTSFYQTGEHNLTL